MQEKEYPIVIGPDYIHAIDLKCFRSFELDEKGEIKKSSLIWNDGRILPDWPKEIYLINRLFILDVVEYPMGMITKPNKDYYEIGYYKG